MNTTIIDPEADPDPLLERLRQARDLAPLAAATGTSIGTVERWQEADSLDHIAGWVRRALSAELHRPIHRAHHGGKRRR